MLLVLIWVAPALVEASIDDHEHYDCHASADAIAALQSDATVTVGYSHGVGYGFRASAGAVPPYLGGRNVSRGVVIMPEDGVAPEAYAPLARGNVFRSSGAIDSVFRG